MPLEDHADAPLTAIAALVRAAVHSDLDPEVLRVVYEDPRDLNDLAGNKLPALAIYRFQEKRRHSHSGIYARDITIRFDYVADAVTSDNRTLRWRSLHNVWNVIADAVVAGKHAAVSAGAEVLCTAGLTVEFESPTVTYNFAREGDSYPFFRGEIKVSFTPEDVEASTLDDFLTHYTSWDEPGETAHDTPLGTDTTTLPAYGS